MPWLHYAKAIVPTNRFYYYQLSFCSVYLYYLLHFSWMRITWRLPPVLHNRPWISYTINSHTHIRTNRFSSSICISRQIKSKPNEQRATKYETILIQTFIMANAITDWARTRIWIQFDSIWFSIVMISIIFRLCQSIDISIRSNRSLVPVRAFPIPVRFKQ